MNSLLKFLPIGNYKCISTNPIMTGAATIERVANGLLFKFNGFKINNDGNKVPEITHVEYLADGTVQNDKIKSGNGTLRMIS